jgi:hypothetical protein
MPACSVADAGHAQLSAINHHAQTTHSSHSINAISPSSNASDEITGSQQLAWHVYNINQTTFALVRQRQNQRWHYL